MIEAQASYTRLAFEQRRRMIASLPEAASHQARVLRTLITANARSRFGREHGFTEIDDLASFRRAVPLRDYAGFAPWIDAAVNGEAQVLTSEEPLLFVTSSGSTGAAKHIPWTRRYVEDAFLPWFYAAIGNTLNACPQAIERDDATLNLKWDPPHAVQSTRAGAPAMGASQVDFCARFGQQLAFEPGTRAPWAPVPSAISDELERIYYRVRLAIESDLRAIVGINPTLIAALPELLRAWQERLLHELRHGTVAGRALRAPNPRRADELNSLANYFGALRPAHVWPNLRIVYCWTGGPARLYMPALAREYGAAVRFMPAPIAASEGAIAVPLDAHPSAGPLVVSCVFYEFIDADCALSDGSPLLTFDQLRAGCHYHVVLSHVGGLYRYALKDVVRVVDHVCDVPRIEYAARHQVQSVMGEELSAHDVIESLQRVLSELGLACRGAAWRCDAQPVGAHYELAIDLHEMGADHSAALAPAIDVALQRRSSRYAGARASAKLGPLQVLQVRGAAFVADFCERVQRGVRPAQVKDRVFIDDAASWEALTRGARVLGTMPH